MTTFLIKFFLWSPFFLFAIILSAVGSVLNRLPDTLSYISVIFLAPSSYILKLIVNDLLHSSKGTPMENIVVLIIENIKKIEE